MSAGGATKTISVAEFEAWLATAGAAARIPYVTGLSIPRGCHVAVAARQACDAGLVNLVQDRHTGPRRYLAVRTSKPLPRALLDRIHARSSSRPDTAADDAEAVLEAIEAAAQARMICPTNRSIASECDIPEHRVKRAIASLRDRGAIQVGFGLAGWQSIRIIAVTASGVSTASPPPLACVLRPRSMELAA